MAPGAKKGPRRGPTSLVGTVDIGSRVLSIDREVFDPLFLSETNGLVQSGKGCNQIFLDAVVFVVEFEHVTFLPER